MKQSQTKGKKIRGQARDKKIENTPKTNKIQSKGEEILILNKENSLPLKKLRMKKAISLIARMTEAKATK